MKITVCAFFTRPNFDIELPLPKIKQQNWKHVCKKRTFFILPCAEIMPSLPIQITFLTISKT